MVQRQVLLIRRQVQMLQVRLQLQEQRALRVRLQLPKRQALLVRVQEQVLLLFYRKLPKQRQR